MTAVTSAAVTAPEYVDADDADAAALTRLRTAFAGTKLEPFPDLPTLRRVERQGHLEVWGPVE